MAQNGEYNLNSPQTLAGPAGPPPKRSCAGATSAMVPTIQIDLYRFAGSIVLRLHGRHYQKVGVVVVDHRRRDVALAHGQSKQKAMPAVVAGDVVAIFQPVKRPAGFYPKA